MLSEDEFQKIKSRNSRIIRAANFVQQNFQEKILLSDLAEAENLSISYLSVFFKKNFNQTFQDYVNTIRFAYAKSLIHSSRTFTDISYEAGFSDPRYLTKAFLKYENCTPNEYRAAHPTISDTDLGLGDGGALATGAIDSSRLLQILKNLRTPLGNTIQRILDADLHINT